MQNMNDGKLFFALMYKDKEILDKAVNELKDNFGKIIAKSEEYDFDFTNYYEKEFDTNLKKTVITFDKEINKKDLINIKKVITTIEKIFP